MRKAKAFELLNFLCFGIYLLASIVTGFVVPPRISQDTAERLLLGQSLAVFKTRRATFLSSFHVVFDGDEGKDDDADDEEDDDDDESDALYRQFAKSEFLDETDKKQSKGEIVYGNQSTALTSDVDWGGALGKLRERFDDMETGKSSEPSHALFRLMSSRSPSQTIGAFISKAQPQVIGAMTGAVSSLLGGLSNPSSGTEVIVKASADKIGSLCLQLQMTGYMFRNAEYVMALKKLMSLNSAATIADYREAFDTLDTDQSGFIERDEIRQLLDDVYEGKTPRFEINTFLQFFDTNQDDKISWPEFERGLGSALAQQNQMKRTAHNLLTGDVLDDDDDDDADLEASVSGDIEVELESGKVVTVQAQEYMNSLKKEARALKDALRRESGMASKDTMEGMLPPGVVSGGRSSSGVDAFGGIAQYIASRRGDLESLTKGISPEVVDTMKKLVDFVLEGGEGAPAKDIPKNEMEMEIPGAALQQLALWQLILGYKLREQEAKGEYLRLLE